MFWYQILYFQYTFINLWKSFNYKYCGSKIKLILSKLYKILSLYKLFMSSNRQAEDHNNNIKTNIKLRYVLEAQNNNDGNDNQKVWYLPIKIGEFNPYTDQTMNIRRSTISIIKECCFKNKLLKIFDSTSFVNCVWN